MNSDSWSSYRAAMPPETFGEPDDEPRRPVPPKCDGCGRFFNPKVEGARFDFTPDSLFSSELCEWLCPAYAAMTPLPPTPDEIERHERETLDAYDKATAEAWAKEMAERQGKCEWCGRELPRGCTLTVCEPCERSVTFDEPPYDGEEIPC